MHLVRVLAWGVLYAGGAAKGVEGRVCSGHPPVGGRDWPVSTASGVLSLPERLGFAAWSAFARFRTPEFRNGQEAKTTRAHPPFAYPSSFPATIIRSSRREAAGAMPTNTTSINLLHVSTQTLTILVHYFIF